MDNGTQFDCATLRKYLKDFKIAVAYSSVCNPQCNSLAEAANKQILNGLQKKLENAKARWIDDIYDVLWSLRTTVKEATGQTPFKLVYGSEALLPVEIGVQSTRVKHLHQEENEHPKILDLELIDEVRENAALKMAAYQNRIAYMYNRKVRCRMFQVGDLVLRNTKAIQKHDYGKLLEKWKGPYIISEDCGNGTYKLRTSDGKPLKHKWNIRILKKYYVWKRIFVIIHL